MRMRVPVLFGAAASFLAASSYVAMKEAELDIPLSVQAHFKCKATAEGCTNNPGPFIKLEGEFFLPGIDGVLIFRNNKKGTHEHEEEVRLKLSLCGDKEIKFAKQPPLGGVGGNPWIFLQLCDDKWDNVSDEILLGRCVQGLNPVSFGYRNALRAFAKIAADCANSPGPYISLGGDLKFRGLGCKLIFRNNLKGTHEHEEDVVLKIEVFKSDDGVIKFAKQPPLGGVGGNPHIWIQYESKGNKLCDEIYLGRCVQLSK